MSSNPASGKDGTRCVSAAVGTSAAQDATAAAALFPTAACEARALDTPFRVGWRDAGGASSGVIDDVVEGSLSRRLMEVRGPFEEADCGRSVSNLAAAITGRLKGRKRWTGRGEYDGGESGDMGRRRRGNG